MSESLLGQLLESLRGDFRTSSRQVKSKLLRSPGEEGGHALDPLRDEPDPPEAGEECLECHTRLETCQMSAHAEVRPEAKGQVVPPRTLEVEAVRVVEVRFVPVR